ncbi:MAG: VOC family protein [Propionibacteriaceae bacterium]|nr:VOC family protein [Propionibacteriaceae bacterium]
MVKFSYTHIYVSDLKASAAFYGDLLGLEVSREFVDEDGTRKAFLVEPGKEPMREATMLELAASSQEHPPVRGGVIIGLEVSSHDEVADRLADAGHTPVVGPFIAGGAFKISEYSGPDGERVGIMEVLTGDSARLP